MRYVFHASTVENAYFLKIRNFCEFSKVTESFLKISSELVVQAYIKRIEEVNSLINAVVVRNFEYALAKAKEVDEFLCRSDQNSEQLVYVCFSFLTQCFFLVSPCSVYSYS